MSALLCLFLAAVAAIQEPDPAGRAAAALREAWKAKDAAAALGALKEHGRTPGPDVVQALAAGLGHKDPAVRRGVLEALRFQPDPSSVEVLLKAGRDKRVTGEPSVAEACYLALGQKADPRAFGLLTRNLRIDRGSRAVRARVLALGRLRQPASVEALMKLLVSGRGRRGNPHMSELRLALLRLTGTDHGEREQDWIAWWSENKRGFRVPPEESVEMPLRLELAWDLEWATPEERERIKRRLRDGARRREDGAGEGS